MIIKLSISVGLHDVYPAMVVNFAFRRKVKMTTAFNCLRELLDKKDENRKNKREEKKREKLLIA